MLKTKSLLVFIITLVLVFILVPISFFVLVFFFPEVSFMILGVISSGIIIILWIPIYLYFYPKSFKELGLVKTKSKISSESFLTLRLNWLKKNWSINTIIDFILGTQLLFIILFYKNINIEVILGADFILLGLFSLIGTYKKFSYVVDNPSYAFYSAIGHEKAMKIWSYILSISGILVGTALFIGNL